MAPLSDDDSRELERRRLVESVSESVEKTLRKRYTWLAVIMSFMIGGGVATAVISLTSSAQKKLIEAEIFLERAEKSVESIDRISSSVKQKYETLDKDLAGLFAGKDNTLEILNETNRKIKQLESRLNEVADAVNALSGEQAVRLPPRIDVGLDNTADKIELSKYTVFAHYYSADGSGRQLMKKLAAYLKEKGYIVPASEPSDYQNRDIRYYHEQDDRGAQTLSKDVAAFFQANGLGDISLDLKDLSASYDNVRKGVIELWLHF